MSFTCTNARICSCRCLGIGRPLSLSTPVLFFSLSMGGKRSMILSGGIDRRFSLSNCGQLLLSLLDSPSAVYRRLECIHTCYVLRWWCSAFSFANGALPTTSQKRVSFLGCAFSAPGSYSPFSTIQAIIAPLHLLTGCVSDLASDSRRLRARLIVIFEQLSGLLAASLLSGAAASAKR